MKKKNNYIFQPENNTAVIFFNSKGKQFKCIIDAINECIELREQRDKLQVENDELNATMIILEASMKLIEKNLDEVLKRVKG